MIAQHLKLFASLSANIDDLIKSKQAAGREGDLQDIKILEMARKSKK